MLVKPITHPILRQRFRGFSAKATRERQRLPGPRARGRPPCGRARRTRPRTARAPGTRRARASRESSGRSARCRPASPTDRKSTRLNSSHTVISYAVFCLKKKKKKKKQKNTRIKQLKHNQFYTYE